MTSSTKHKDSLLRQRLIDQMRIANLADNTQQSYLREIERLARHYGQSPEQLDAEQIRAWVLELIDRGLHPGSTNVCLSALRFFFRDTLGRPDLVAGLRNRKIPRKLPRHLEEEEVERLLLAAPDLRYRAAMLTAYAAGLRISETLSLQVSDIHADRRLLHIRAGKGGHERMAPLPEWAIAYLRSYWRSLYPRPASWLFHGKSPDTPVKTATLNFAFLRARDRAGIHRRHTFHSLRHYILYFFVSSDAFKSLDRLAKRVNSLDIVLWLPLQDSTRDMENQDASGLMVRIASKTATGTQVFDALEVRVVARMVWTFAETLQSLSEQAVWDTKGKLRAWTYVE